MSFYLGNNEGKWGYVFGAISFLAYLVYPSGITSHCS
jgi:hypothetical protein